MPDSVKEIDSELEAAIDKMDIPEAQKAQLKRAAKSKAKAKRISADEIETKYPHVISGTLEFDANVGKQSVEIACQHEGCEETRRVFTSDLFQVRTCVEHKAEERKARKTEQRVLLAKAKEMIKAQQA